MTTSSALALATACALLGACSSSSTPTHETSDAGTDGHAEHDGSKTEDAAHDAGVDAPPQPVFGADAGVTWTALYRDYFGNESAVHTAGCANGSFCHGSTTADGYEASSGYLCPKDDKDGCYKSLTSQAEDGPQLVAPDAGWENDYLSSVLCEVDDKGQPTGDGTMPYSCVYNFTPTDIERIKAWIAAGYPNN